MPIPNAAIAIPTITETISLREPKLMYAPNKVAPTPTPILHEFTIINKDIHDFLNLISTLLLLVLLSFLNALQQHFLSLMDEAFLQYSSSLIFHNHQTPNHHQISCLFLFLISSIKEIKAILLFVK